ncbi:MAG: hypothetical protein PGN29_00490 [Gordonia paraffinivorans]
MIRAKNYGTIGRTVHAHLLTDNGAVSELWLDPPKREREERDDKPIYIASASETFRFRPDGVVVRTDLTRGTFAMMWAGAHHSRLFAAHLRWPWDASPGGFDLGEPASIESVTYEGRRAWEVTFRGAERFRSPDEVFVIDDESGLVLRWTDGSDGLSVMSFVLDEEFDDSLFSWEGDWITDDDESAELMRRQEERQAKIADIPISRPTWFPSEITVTANEGDPDTGALDMSVSLKAPYVTLRRWLTTLEEPKSSQWMPESHSISDGTWTHQLRWQQDALTVDDADRILRSIPPVGDEQSAADVVARMNAESDTAQRELTSPGEVTKDETLFSGEVSVSYHQFYLATQQEWSGDYWASFTGQRNGLIGTVDSACAPIGTGLHTGEVEVTVSIQSGRPPLDLENWEEIVEAPFTVDAPFFLSGWAGEGPSVELPLPRGTYRVRLCARDMDAAHEADTGSGIDTYHLTFWPSPLAQDQIIKQTSAVARSQHDYVKSLTEERRAADPGPSGTADASARLFGPSRWPSD